MSPPDSHVTAGVGSGGGEGGRVKGEGGTRMWRIQGKGGMREEGERRDCPS